MRDRFDEQLGMLNVGLIRMGALCEDAIAYTARILMGEINLKDEVIKTAVSYTHLTLPTKRIV